MAVIKFTAVNRGELPSWLAAGATFYLANNFQQFPRRLVAKGQRDETLDGTPEGYLHALQREYSIVTDFIPLHERDVWRAFFTSVANVEPFQIDFSARQLLGNYGFEASGSSTPGWSSHPGGSGFTVDATAPALGIYSGRVTLAINANSTLVSQPLGGTGSNVFPVSVGKSVLLQAVAKRDESSLPNRNLLMAPTLYDVGGAPTYSTAVATALSATSGFQLLSGTATAPANTVGVAFTWYKASPTNTNEAGRWLFDEHLLAVLSTWQDVYLVDTSIDEQQIGGVGVRYSFKVKTLP